jgi:hypothetical protein
MGRGKNNKNHLVKIVVKFFEDNIIYKFGVSKHVLTMEVNGARVCSIVQELWNST